MWKKWWVWVIIMVVVGGVISWLVANKHKTAVSPTNSTSSTTTNSSTTASSSAIKDGKDLSDNKCNGSGTVPLTSAPMKPADISIIEPYGLTVGGHVTPVDHEYYWAKNNTKDSSDVLALADGHMVDFEFRSHHGQGPIPGDYRVVTTYSCTFLSYFDLATSLAPDIESQLPTGWEKSGFTSANIPIKAGQVVAKMGGQSLDFAVWDTTKTNSKLLVPSAYTAEPWKIHTVPPLNYFTTDVKNSILPFYVRQAEPRDGTYAYDVAGAAIGTWFLKGSGGYNTNQAGGGSYWAGHLAIAPDFIDPTTLGFSIGDYQGQATQFTVKPPFTDPATITAASGAVKLTLLHPQQYLLPNQQTWNSLTTPSALPLTLPTTGAFQATALIQVVDNQTLKVELFPNKTADQVTAFDASAKTYTRSGQ